MVRKKRLVRKTPLAKMSRKRKAESRIYSRLRQEFLKDHPHCQFPLCFNTASQIHHLCRRGRNYLTTEHFRAVCNRCHTWIHEHGKLARKLNWLR
jgi:hypothetical protein